LAWGGAGGGKDDDVGGKAGLFLGVLSHLVEFVAQRRKVDGGVAFALDVPLFAAFVGVFAGDDVAAFVARATVPLDGVELDGAFDEPVDKALKVVGGEVIKVVLVFGGGCRCHRLSLLQRLRAARGGPDKRVETGPVPGRKTGRWGT